MINNFKNLFSSFSIGLSLLLLFGCSKLTIAQNGKLISKTLINLQETPIWNRISNDGKLKSEFNHVQALDFYAIKYQNDGNMVKGMSIEPKANGKFPVVIFNRGGNRNFGKLTVGALLIYTSELASEGYIIIGSNYRKEDEFGGKELSDVLILKETLKSWDNADLSCIGMFGWSRGGMMTYLALKNADFIKTAIVGNGATDLLLTAKDRPMMETNVFAECIPNYLENKEEALKERSVIYWPEQLSTNTSLLILAASRDKRVNPKHARDLSKKLNDINYKHSFLEFNTDHFFLDKKEELNKVVINWFDKELKVCSGN